MADVRRRLADCVIVWKYDRFARSLGVLIINRHMLKLTLVECRLVQSSVEGIEDEWTGRIEKNQGIELRSAAVVFGK